jgi:phosphoglycolate phosphatase-like HAD superfamily hydrolase
LSNPSYDKLKALKPQHEFFIGIDSDGCVFDSMEIKHKECFIPPFIKHFELQPISKYAREAAEFTNLYSKSRGANRFIAYLQALELLTKRKDVIDRNFKVPLIESLKRFINSGNSIDNPGLQKLIDANPKDTELKQIRDWSLDVNKTVKELVRNVPPFPLVPKCLEKAKALADLLVVSSTPEETLQHEWKESNILQYITVIAGQETGTKKDVLNAATKGKYKEFNTLMIGDAPGDYAAAKANNALFFPINPGYESESWERFNNEGFDKFISGKFAGDYEKNLLKEFDKLLPEKPIWKVIS